MLVVIVTLQGKPDKRDALAPALAKAAAASRGEVGCLSYSFTADLEDDNRFLSVETWTDQASLDAHMATPHVAELLALAGEALEGAPDLKVYDTTGPA